MHEGPNEIILNKHSLAMQSLTDADKVIMRDNAMCSWSRELIPRCINLVSVSEEALTCFHSR